MLVIPYCTIDLPSYPRAAHFALFQGMAMPYFTVGEDIDVTDFFRAVKERKDPVFLTLNYCAGRAANRLPEFRRRIWEGQIFEF